MKEKVGEGVKVEVTDTPVASKRVKKRSEVCLRDGGWRGKRGKRGWEGKLVDLQKKVLKLIFSFSSFLFFSPLRRIWSKGASFLLKN